jgi:urease accessory protein
LNEPPNADLVAATRAFEDAPELAAYRDQPPQMPAGAVGKDGLLRLGFEYRADRTILAELAQRAPMLAQKALYYDEAMPDLPHVMIICTAGGTLQGDRQTIEIDVGENAAAHVTTQSATKIQEMDANYAAQTQEIVVRDNGYLEYLPDPIIPYRNARFITQTRMRVAPSATLLYAEILMPGRTHYRAGERFEYALFSSTTRAERLDGTALCSEKFVVEPRRRDLRNAGVLGQFDLFANVLLFTKPEHAERIFAETPAQFSADKEFACGATRLPNGAGLAYKIVGRDREVVQACVRAFWSRVRRQVKCAEVAPQFNWR